MKVQLSKGKVPKQAHVAIPEGLYEEEHGRQGFFGPVTQFYHTHPPTDWKRIEGPLKPRAFNTYDLKPADLTDPRGEPTKVLYNNDVALFISRRTAPMPFCFRNGDGDEVHFIHKGRGVLQSDFGPLSYGAGDYLVIPKGTTYRLVPETRDNFSMIIQSRTAIRFPDRAGIGHYAPFDYDVIETPEPAPVTEQKAEWELRVRRRGEHTSVFYDFCPLDVVGWKGTQSVFKLNVKDFRPLMSEGVHLPPSAHGTFEADGFVICTFAPRPLEGDPQALRVPWYHRNIDYDEVFFVHSGEFTLSRRSGTTPFGVLSLNPQGLHHGPQPGVWENSVKNWQKDARLEFVAINLDTEEPLIMTPEAQGIEIPGYADLWAKK